MNEPGDVGGEGVFPAGEASDYLSVIIVAANLLTDVPIAVGVPSDVHLRASLVCGESRCRP